MGILKSKSKKLLLIPIFITICLDFVAIGVVLPVLTPLLLNPTNQILPLGTSVAGRTIILGLLISCFSIASFFGAPLMGAWSDKLGRKYVLRYTLFVSFLSYLLFALGVSIANIALLFVARILGGFAGASVNTCVAAMVDITEHKERVKNFGLIGMASFACGYVVGPVLGGFFSNSTLSPFFNVATPFYVIALWSLMNLGINELLLEETLEEKVDKKITLLTGVTAIFKALDYPTLRVAFILSFLITFSFNFFDQFFQIFLTQKFHFGTPQIASMIAFLGLWMALTQGIMVRFIPKKISPPRILLLCLPLVAFFISLVIIPSNPKILYLIVPFIAIFQGLVWPYSAAFLSSLTDAKSQGEVLGVNTSLIGLAIGLPSLLAGFLGAWNYNLPIIIGAIFALLAWFIFLGAYIKSHGFSHLLDT